jgi:hypothetical protein
MRMHFPKRQAAGLIFLAYAIALGALILAADAGWLSRPLRLIHGVPGGDKFGHFLLFGVFSFLANNLWPTSEWWRRGVRLSRLSLALLALIVLEELSQLAFQARTFDAWDIVAGALGVWLFGAWATRRRAMRLQPRLAMVKTFPEAND